MQNPTSTNISPISERFLALIAEGVEKFGMNTTTHMQENSHSVSAETSVKEITNCQKCVLAKTRKRVVVEKTLTPKDFLILSDFPEIEDEDGSTVFHSQATSGIILNLIDKLGITQNCHQAFALKCTSSKNTPEQNMSTCVLENLQKELSLVLPKVLLCFGMRSFLALSRLDNTLLTQMHGTQETQHLPYVFNFKERQIELFVLPTTQELKQFPHWRADVWAKLLHFRQKKED